jgi:hypothetical protein
MNVLFIGSSKYDYLQDLTYNGLVKTLGSRSVVEAKTVLRYHFPLKEYPKNLGYEGFDLSFMAKGFYKKFDLVVVASAKPDCFALYEKMLPKMSPSVKTVFIDGGDNPLIGGDFTRLNCPELYERVIGARPFDVIFKREYLKTSTYAENVYPLPFSIQTSRYPALSDEPYKYDVAFWAVESDPIRTKALDFLENRYDCAANGTARNQTFHKYKRKGLFYFEELKRTKISLNFRGTGWDTLRYWEVLGLQSFMISQRLQIEIPNDFEEGKEIIYCMDDLSDLDDLCQFYLKKDSLRQQIAGNAYAKAMAWHTVESRAKYLLEKCGWQR